MCSGKPPTVTISYVRVDERYVCQFPGGVLARSRMVRSPRISPAGSDCASRWSTRCGRSLSDGTASDPPVSRPPRPSRRSRSMPSCSSGWAGARPGDLVRRRAGTLYDPILAMCFCRAAGELFPRMACQSAWQAVLAAEPGAQRQLHGVRLDEALQAIGDAADLHTRGAAGHARMVAVLAESAAERCALPKWDAITLRYAGLVQDIGMFAVTAGLGAQGRPLNEAEREHVRLHPYYTERILARSLALAAIGALAALHHERLDGSGSYRGLSAAQLPLTARILAAADVYAALSQPRPYRTASPPGAAAEELRREVREGHLDSDAVSAVLAAAGHRVRGTRGMHLAGLTDREIEVLRLLSSGLVNHQMAEALGISTNTVDHHIRHIYNKIDASSRAAATRFAMQHQIVDPAWHDGSSISAEK